MDPGIQAAYASQCRLKLGNDTPQPLGAREQRLTPVQDHLHGAQRVRARMLADAPCRPGYHRVRHDHGLPAPALVGGLVDVAVITRQIAPAMNLQHELAQRDRRLAHAEQSN